MDDLISRQAVLDGKMVAVISGQAIDVVPASYIKDLPSAQPERPRGKWVVVTRHEHYPSGKPYEQLQCPFCKRLDRNGDGSFCGYCGADMRQENDNIPMEYYENGGR